MTKSNSIPTNKKPPIYSIDENIRIQYNPSMTEQAEQTALHTLAHMHTPKRGRSPGITTDTYEKVFKPFLAATTEQMYAQSKAARIQVAPGAIRIYEPPPQINLWQAMDTSRDYFVNIICFGRSFQYLMKYVAYLFRDYVDLDANVVVPLHVFLFCDQESYQHYREEPLEYGDRPDFSFVRGFHRHLGNYERGGYPYLPVPPPPDETGKKKKMSHPCDYSKHHVVYANDETRYALTSQEMAILSRLQVYMIYSPHYLMKGVGGKRALIHWFHSFFVAQQNPDHICMTLDDNITGIYQVEACAPQIDCSVRSINKHCRDTDIPSLSCLAMYDILKTVVRSTGVYMAGIVKGGGQASDDSERTIVRGSAAIYKMTVCQPVRLSNERYLYNPYFTRFYEDLAFNNELAAAGKTAKLKNYQLNFGHFQSKDGDHEDDMPAYLAGRYHVVEGVEPVYAVYFLYVACLYAAGHLSYEFGKIDAGKNDLNSVALPYYRVFRSSFETGITMPVNSKYAKYSYLLYMFANMYCWMRPWPGKESIQARVSKKNSYLTLLNKWINVGIFSTRVENRVLQYSFAAAYEKMFVLAEEDNTHLGRMWSGEYRAGSKLYKQLQQQVDVLRDNDRTRKKDMPKDFICTDHLCGLEYQGRTRKRGR